MKETSVSVYNALNTGLDDDGGSLYNAHMCMRRRYKSSRSHFVHTAFSPS